MHVYIKPPTLQVPIRKSPLRFAVGRPDGASSNSWKLWTVPAGDVYVACRDNFRDMKVSLHASGRWRLGFTERAINGRPDLLTPGRIGPGISGHRHPTPTPGPSSRSRSYSPPGSCTSRPQLAKVGSPSYSSSLAEMTKRWSS